MSNTLLINDLPVNIVTKNIRNLNLRITPPLGNVTISAPYGFPESKIQDFVRSKMHWIRKHQERIRNTEYRAPLKFETGEEHSYLGKKYHLEVIESKGRMRIEEIPNFKLSNTKNEETEYILRMFVKTRTSRKKRQAIMDSWYRERLKEIIPGYVSQYGQKMNVQVSNWGIKKMKTKWGTCNITKKRIWLNLELAKKPVEAIEQVVVHELVHLLERKHTKRFYNLVEMYLGRKEDLL
jgi:predicted metal-dependent hydrolase